MNKAQISAAAFADTKPHYNILNGLRGIAAMVVVWFHIFEAFATSHVDQSINHGYLAVDFFFILSGFVIGYAYEDRWGKSMNTKDFMKRRVIRLQPLVVFGAFFGAAMFYFQKSNTWDVNEISGGSLVIATILNALMIPATVGMEIRGLGEMFPLNGPSWSLFFEYIGVLMYAFIIRKLSIRALTAVVVVMGMALTAFSLNGGDICMGYSLSGIQFLGGFLRLSFAFSAGLLLSRVFKPIKIRGSFWITGLFLVILLAIPRIGGYDHLWMNGIYDAVCSIIFFPILVYLGASGKTTDKATTEITKFLGDISYPLYIVHYPFIYLYYGWVKINDLTFQETIPHAIALFVGSIALAYLALKLFDIPARRWLSKKWLHK